MRIGLIDVDGHNFPSLPLMKLSAWHTVWGDTVEWWDGFSPTYDRVYMCKVFSDEYSPDVFEPVNAREIVKGGTGYAIKLERGKEVYHPELDPPLPLEIEHIYPDYSLYPKHTGHGLPLAKQTAYGFLTRGCPRGCAFCHVVPKEGRASVKVAELSEFWSGQGKIRLCDPNILACRQAPQLLEQLAETGARVEFNQGLDARLLTPDTADLLASMRLAMPHFAMDTHESMEAVKRGLKLYVEAVRRHKGCWNYRWAKVFCLTNFNTTHEQDMERIRAIQECECWPYITIYNKPTAPTITRNLCRWSNNSIIYNAQPDFEKYDVKKG